jgi:hypothetical protein
MERRRLGHAGRDGFLLRPAMARVRAPLSSHINCNQDGERQTV